jgi:hypothetical protein
VRRDPRHPRRKEEGVVIHRGIAVLWLAGAMFAAGAVFAADDKPGDPALTALVKALHDKGVIDEEQYSEISAKAAAEDAKEATVDWWERLSFYGDFRARYEGFFYEHGPDGTKPDDQQRGRYRVRFGMRADINEYVDAILQLASGGGDNRSGNQSFGGNLDFGKDAIDIDQAYIEFNAFPVDGTLPLGSKLFVDAGRVPDAFVSKFGKDILLWDNDINFSGADVRASMRPAEALELYLNTGYFIIDENSGAKDPALFAAQIGAVAKPTSLFNLGARVSFYQFDSLNSAFVMRAADSTSSSSVTTGGGNILDGLTGSANGGDMGVIESRVYAQSTFFSEWPLTLYGTVSSNLGADSSALFPGVGDNDLAWAAGLEVGDKKKFAMLGVMYAYLQANAFPSMYVDSDLFDGRTNRKGWAFYGSRQLFSNTDLNLTVFVSDPIRKSLPAFDDSVPGSERVRFQSDVVVKF